MSSNELPNFLGAGVDISLRGWANGAVPDVNYLNAQTLGDIVVLVNIHLPRLLASLEALGIGVVDTHDHLIVLCGTYLNTTAAPPPRRSGTPRGQPVDALLADKQRHEVLLLYSQTTGRGEIQEHRRRGKKL